MYNTVASQGPDFNNPALYKKTHKKKYMITAYMPPMGTAVTNFLEQANYITTPEKQFVLIGTVGEQWVIDAAKLAKTYTFPDGSPITQARLKRMCIPYMHNGVQTGVIREFRVVSKEGPINWAVHVPLNYCFQIPTAWGDMLTVNAPGIQHGSGDFLVCSNRGGRPNINDRWVVNGAVFPSTYDIRAWSR